MMIEIVGVMAAGVLLGAWFMKQKQKKSRQEELKRISQLLEKMTEDINITSREAGAETMLSRIEHQMIRIQEISVRRKEEIQKSHDEIQTLISEIAHQMRTPLTNMETYSGFLLEEIEKRGECTMQMYVSAILESEQKLHFLVESFIKMSRLEHHMIQLRLAQTDLSETICDMLRQVDKKAEEKQILFSCDLFPNAVCSHDPNWLGEALYNIFDNAVKYSRFGGKIKIKLQKQEMFWKILVRDFGIGIHEGEEHKIFQRFYRGENVTTQPGFGIGLYLARKIVNLHGGFLVAKRKNPGLQMEINLPRRVF